MDSPVRLAEDNQSRRRPPGDTWPQVTGMSDVFNWVLKVLKFCWIT